MAAVGSTPARAADPAGAGRVPAPEFATPPGGYWAPGEAPSVPPKDGHEQLIAAYVTIPLGVLSTASGIASVVLSAPGHCERRLGSLGYQVDEEQCRDLFILSAVRTGYGAAMLLSGVALLGVGLVRRKRHRLWKERRFDGGTVVARVHGGRLALGARVRWRF